MNDLYLGETHRCLDTIGKVGTYAYSAYMSSFFLIDQIIKSLFMTA